MHHGWHANFTQHERDQALFSAFIVLVVALAGIVGLALYMLALGMHWI